MKQILSTLVLISILTSCSRENQLNLVFNNSTGLTEKCPLLLNGYQIGEVKRMELLDDQRTFVIIGLTEEIEIPNDSKFKIERTSLLGDVAINVELGKSKTKVSPQDTIPGTYSTKLTEIEKGIQKVVKNLVDASDSLKTNTGNEEKK